MGSALGKKLHQLQKSQDQELSDKLHMLGDICISKDGSKFQENASRQPTKETGLLIQFAENGDADAVKKFLEVRSINKIMGPLTKCTLN